MTNEANTSDVADAPSVLKKINEVDLHISIPAMGKGGQHVGCYYGVVVEHLPTGIKVEVPSRSQLRSKAIALKMIEYALTFDKDF
jgi:protein subunit release factor A